MVKTIKEYSEDHLKAWNAIPNCKTMCYTCGGSDWKHTVNNEVSKYECNLCGRVYYMGLIGRGYIFGTPGNKGKP